MFRFLAVAALAVILAGCVSTSQGGLQQTKAEQVIGYAEQFCGFRPLLNIAIRLTDKSTTAYETADQLAGRICSAIERRQTPVVDGVVVKGNKV